MCQDDSIALNAVPPGGTFQLLSGPATLNSNMLKSVGVGNILIAYTITQNGCTTSDQKMVISAAIPEPTFNMDTSAMCSGSSRALSATPEGGIFWVIGGPGKVGNGMLTSTGKGTIKLLYLVNNEGCVGDTVQVIPSKLTPEVAFATDTLYTCVGEAYLIDIIPESSQLNLLSGPGTLNGHMLTTTGPGILELTGQWEENGCVGMDTVFISSNPIPVPEITLIDTVICIGNSIQLTADPAGGTFEILSGAGTLNGDILTSFDTGPIKIVYKAEENHCIGMVQDEVMVIDPIAEIIISNDVLTSASPTGVFQWLDCEHHFEPLPGETNNTLMITQSGSYALVNGTGDCMDTSSCVSVQITGAYHGEPDERIRVFPNPVSSKLFIEDQDRRDIREISLFNSLGRQVWTISEKNAGAYFDMHDKPNGIYFLVIKLDDEQDYIFRVVKM